MYHAVCDISGSIAQCGEVLLEKWKNYFGYSYFISFNRRICLYRFFDNPFSEKRRISQVEEYIANQPQTSEISNIYAEWDSKRGDYDIFVVFDNEPNLTYNYIIHSEEKEVVLLIIREKVNRSIQEIKEGENGVAEGDPVNEDYWANFIKIRKFTLIESRTEL